jgi:excisionase family DNA binding protein
MSALTLDVLAQGLFPTRNRKEFVSFRDASEQSGLSDSTLRRLAKAGRLQTMKVGGRQLVRQESLDSLLNDLSS